MNTRIFAFGKVFLIALAVIVAAGAVCYFAFGFNLGFDLEGGTQIVVDLGNAFDMDHVRSAFHKAGIQNARFLSASDGGVADIAIVRVPAGEDLTGAAEQARQTLVDRYPETEISSVQTIGGDANTSSVWNALGALGIAAGIAALYALLRGSLSAALTLLLSAAAQALAAVGLSLLCRLEINGSFAVALLGGALAGLGLYVFLVVRLAEADKRFSPRQCARLMPASETMQTHGTLLYVFCGIAALLALLFGAIGLNTLLDFTLPLLLSVLAAVAVAVLFAPACWVLVQDGINRAKLRDKAITGAMPPRLPEKKAPAAPREPQGSAEGAPAPSAPGPKKPNAGRRTTKGKKR